MAGPFDTIDNLSSGAAQRRTLRVVLDARPAMRNSTGVGNYVLGIARGFAALAGNERRKQDVSLRLFTSSLRDPPGDQVEQLAGSCRAIHQTHRKVPVRLLNAAWHHLRWPPIERFAGALDVAHSPHPLLLPTGGAQVVTVHDLYFLDNPQDTRDEIRRDYGKLLWRSVARAEAVVCVSHATADDLRDKIPAPHADRLEEKLHVVPNGVDSERLVPSAPAAKSDYLLAVGRIEPRKNVHRTLEAFAQLPQSIRLIWAGMPAHAEDEREFDETCRQLGISERVERRGYVPSAQLASLYSQALALVFASLHEGFGLPILEAMAARCPVVTSQTSAMPEVAGNAAILVDPLDVDSMVGGITEALRSDRRAELERLGLERVKQFSWASSAEQTVEVWKQAAIRAGEQKP